MSEQAQPAVDSSSTPRRQEHRRGRNFGLERFSALYLLGFFFLVFGIAKPSLYLTTTSINVVLSQEVTTAILALAFLIPLAAETYDLSIGAVMSLALVVVTDLSLHTSFPVAVDVILAIACCALSGMVSGFIVVRLHVSSFIATLAVSEILTALVLLFSGGDTLVGKFSLTYLGLGRGNFFGVPDVAYYLVVIAIILWYLLEHTPFGRFLFATGGNSEAARLAGVPTGRLIWTSLIVSSVLAGLAGIVFSMSVGTFSPDVGPGYLFPAIAGVFFGAVQFKRRPNVWGTLIALYSLSFGVEGLELVFDQGVDWITPLFQGVALVAAVALASRQGIIRLPRLRKKENSDAGL
jgi:ribose transport system permease protein